MPHGEVAGEHNPPACWLSLVVLMLVAGDCSAKQKGHVWRKGPKIQCFVCNLPWMYKGQGACPFPLKRVPPPRVLPRIKKRAGEGVLLPAGRPNDHFRVLRFAVMWFRLSSTICTVGIQISSKPALFNSIHLSYSLFILGFVCNRYGHALFDPNEKL